MQNIKQNIMYTAINTRNANKYIKNKMSSSLIILPLNFKPGAKDILCGRGNVFSNHEGNRYFGRIIRANLREYREASNRPEKIKVVDEILEEIQLSGARFTKVDRETKRWYELNDVQAHQKIGHAIRDTIRLLKSKKRNPRPNTARSKMAKRKRQTSALKPQNHVLPSSGTRKKTTDDILKMSIETLDFLNDLCFQSENLPPQPRSQQPSEYIEVKKESPQPYNHQKTPSTGFLLKNEYPEESFDFSPTSFFGDLNNYDARPIRITRQ
jgi:hypothetical protein